MAIRAIAHQLRDLAGYGQKTLPGHELPRYGGAAQVVDREPPIRTLLVEFLDTPTSVIMGRVGWVAPTANRE